MTKGRVSVMYCGSIYESVLKVWIARQKLGAEEGSIAEASVESDMDLQVRWKVW